MKEITAIIQPMRLGPVREALSAAGVHGMTIIDARGFGSQGGSTDSYRGVEYHVDYTPKTRIDVVVPDAIATSAVEAIQTAAQTGKVGDGKIFIRDVASVIRIRTGERDEVALN